MAERDVQRILSEGLRKNKTTVEVDGMVLPPPSRQLVEKLEAYFPHRSLRVGERLEDYAVYMARVDMVRMLRMAFDAYADFTSPVEGNPETDLIREFP